MTEKKVNTTYDLAVLLEKISQLLKSLPEAELSDLKQLTEIVDLTYEMNNEKKSSTIPKNENVVPSITIPFEENNWKADEELKNMTKEELTEYLNNRVVFPVKGGLYSYANFLNIKGISKRTSRADIIDVITKHYERNRMFKTMSEAGNNLG